MSTQENKDVVIAFGELAFAQQKPAEAVAQYVGATYTQHNPQAPDGPEAFVAVLEGIFGQMPGAVFDVKRVIAEDDLVVLHTHLIPAPGAAGLAVVDIFRVADGKIVEHWDVVQPVPDEAANDNTMF
jgi:predicted SnoaL-like aldol condensation-catalyzing enzyme